MRSSCSTIISTTTGSRFFGGLCGRSVVPNGTNETAHQAPVTNIEKSLRGVAEATATIDPTQPPSLEPPRERAGFWATFKATVSLSGVASTLVAYLDEKVRRLLNFRRP